MLFIIGARRYTMYSVLVIESLIPQICARGITVTTGMGIGVSSLVLNCAVRNKGTCIAYLPFGHKLLRRNKVLSKLARDLVGGGGRVISPFKPSQKPTAETYRYRDEIILNKCLAVLVIESTLDGETIKTAMRALYMGKPVYVVPGSVFKYASQGNNHLLNFGAKTVSAVEDIIML